MHERLVNQISDVALIRVSPCRIFCGSFFQGIPFYMNIQDVIS